FSIVHEGSLFGYSFVKSNIPGGHSSFVWGNGRRQERNSRGDSVPDTDPGHRKSVATSRVWTRSAPCSSSLSIRLSSGLRGYVCLGLNVGDDAGRPRASGTPYATSRRGGRDGRAGFHGRRSSGPPSWGNSGSAARAAAWPRVRFR